MPAFSEILGQQLPHRRLRQAAARSRLPHAFLFHGAPGVGKTSTAFALARYLNCARPGPEEACGACSSCRKMGRLQHPDLHWFFPMPASLKGGKRSEHIRENLDRRLAPEVFRFSFPAAASIAIGRDGDTRAGSVSELRRQAGMAPVEGSLKVFVISEAERMTAAAANSLLKVLEEPPPDNLLILCTANPGALLDTIVSRCQALRFPDLPESLVADELVRRLDLAPQAARLAAALGRGSLTRAAAMAADDIVAVRDRAVDLASLHPADPRAHALIAELAALKDRDVLRRIFEFALLWQEDLLRVVTGSPIPLANRDREAVLRDQAAATDVEAIRGRVRALDEARRAMEGNVYLPLVLHGLLAGLSDPAVV